MLKQTTTRLTELDRKNVRRIMAHIRRLNREAGIRSPVSQQDAIAWALHRAAALIAPPVKVKAGGKGK